MELIFYLLVCSAWDWFHQRVPFWAWFIPGVVLIAHVFSVTYIDGWIGLGLGFALPLVAGMGAADSRVLALVGAVVGAPMLAGAWITSVTTLWGWGWIGGRSLVGVPFLPWYSTVQVGLLFIMWRWRF